MNPSLAAPLVSYLARRNLPRPVVDGAALLWPDVKVALVVGGGPPPPQTRRNGWLVDNITVADNLLVRLAAAAGDVCAQPRSQRAQGWLDERLAERVAEVLAALVGTGPVTLSEGAFFRCGLAAERFAVALPGDTATLAEATDAGWRVWAPSKIEATGAVAAFDTVDRLVRQLLLRISHHTGLDISTSAEEDEFLELLLDHLPVPDRARRLDTPHGTTVPDFFWELPAGSAKKAVAVFWDGWYWHGGRALAEHVTEILGRDRRTKQVKHRVAEEVTGAATDVRLHDRRRRLALQMAGIEVVEVLDLQLPRGAGRSKAMRELASQLVALVRSLTT
ncbi:MAG: hypothetical protein GY882_08755 [Actinomycetia bacterium]|nr:hypothetical protein [Actinomycetes bacterium]